MSPTQTLITKINTIIKEIAAMPPVKEGKTIRAPQSAQTARPVRASAPGWANFAATIKANDKAANED